MRPDPADARTATSVDEVAARIRAARFDLTVWVDVPLELATQRGMRRDGEAGNDHDSLWRDVWAPTERAFDARFAPRDVADLRYVAD